jgi:hypothetical protein
VLKRTLIAALAAIVLVVGAAIPALALTTQSWEERRIATEAFDEAAAAATAASADSEAAHTRLEGARDVAADTLAEAQAVASAAAGYFAAPLVVALQSQATALDGALAAEAPDGPAMPDTERPESIADLKAAVAPLAEWASGESERATLVTELAAELETLTESTEAATTAVVETVTAEATAALAAAPLATPETRAAVETARDGVLDAEDDLAKAIGGYTAAVAAVRASQQAAVDAAAAANAAQQGSGLNDSDVQGRLEDLLGGIRPSFCDIFPDITDPACD